MLVTVPFLAFVGLVALISLSDWRRGLLLAIVVGVLQDPVRKLTPGAPVWMMLPVVSIFGVILFSTLPRVQVTALEFARRFPQIAKAAVLFLLFLVIAGINGLVTFGFSAWKAPMLSFGLYSAPIPAVLLAYLWADDETRVNRLLLLYSVVTGIALTGTYLEYLRVDVPGLGLVRGGGWDYIRHLPGLQIRMISGFYRSPDTMGIHAGTLTCIAIARAARAGFSLKGWPWLLTIGWGFTAALISGRRKALYFIIVFTLVFLWRYFRSMRLAEVVGVALAGALVAIVVTQVRSSNEANVYARGALASGDEIAERFEGGSLETIRQIGFMGAGLGVATQGTQYFSAGQQFGWQEGGLPKIIAELGVPGILAAGVLALALFSVLLKLTGIPDFQGSTQVNRVLLFGLLAANGASFIASAQAYSDPLIMLLVPFFLGSLLATTRFDEAPATSRASDPSTDVGNLQATGATAAG
jgi:hypothetical protein